ncbi:hypothetical protein HMPREF3036_01894 [Sutterella sp. KLE1602]|nr:hypothetical protein HMPREF3036_01894 [Sutterella sp. KLE1602]
MGVSYEIQTLHTPDATRRCTGRLEREGDTHDNRTKKGDAP